MLQNNFAENIEQTKNLMMLIAAWSIFFTLAVNVSNLTNYHGQ